MSEEKFTFYGWEKLGCGEFHHVVVRSKDIDTDIYLDGIKCEINKNQATFDGGVSNVKFCNEPVSEEEILEEHKKSSNVSEELKPCCPFCGGEAYHNDSDDCTACEKCGVKTLTELWNTRPIEDALNRRIELALDRATRMMHERDKLKAENEKLRDGQPAIYNKGNYIAALESFMEKIAKKTKCLPSFADPDSGNQHIYDKIDKALKGE